MASWFTRALDTITPWNRGGEVQRRQEKKKKDEEEAARRLAFDGSPGVRPTVKNVTPNQPSNQPQTQRPENLFADLNKSLNIGRPVSATAIPALSQTDTKPPLRPGAVVKPTNKPAPLPDEEFRTITDKGEENKKILGKNAAWLLPKRFEKRTKVAVEGSYKTNKDKFVAQFDKMDQERREIYLRGIREQAKNKIDEQGREIPDSGDPIAIRSLRTLENANRAGSQRDLLQRGADLASVPGRSVIRVGTGVTQGLSGIYDLATPGEGTSRTSKFLDQVAKNQDTSAEEAGVGTAYRVVNVPTEIASYFIPSTLATKIASKFPKGVKITEEIVEKVAKLTDNAGEAGKVRKFLANRMRSGWTLDQAIEEGLQSAKYTGENASKGNDTSPVSVGTDIATAVGGSLLFPGNRVLKKKAQASESVEDVIGATTAAGSELLENNLNRSRRIPVKQNIPVDEVIDELEQGGKNIPVNVTPTETPQGPIIRELGGDATQVTSNNAIADRAEKSRRARAEAHAKATTPNARTIQASNGFVPSPPKFLGEAGDVKQIEIDTERAMLDDALANKEITKTQHKAANKALDETVASDAALPQGRKIEVKQVQEIPVRDETVVPTEAGTPGTVRATTSAEPMAAKTEAAANAPVVASPAQLPAEVQEVLDNPKKFTKRQVAAARNQRKLARQMAKTQEQTAEALERINTVSPAAQSGEGFVPTGEFGKSENGGAYQKASRQTELAQAMQETSQMSPGDVIQTARANQAETGGFNRRDIRNIHALIESKRIVRGTPEWEEARQILKQDGTVWGQTGALRNYTMRRTASASELISRYESKIYKLADDPTKIQSSWFDEVERAEETYVAARDNATAAYNRFTENPTSANAKAYHAAQDAAEKADSAAKQVEYSVAQKALKKNTDVKQTRELQKLAQDADMYQMDAVDASMLSGTGTFVRNFVNSTVGNVEEAIFGRPAAWIARKLTGENVAGGVGRGSVKGFGKGFSNIVDASKARASNAGKNPLEHLKNWSTTGNQLGDAVIDSQATKNTLDHYTNLLKEQGYKGRELRDRAGVMARVDPDNVNKTYTQFARIDAGLGGSNIAKRHKLEAELSEKVSEVFGMGKPTPRTDAAAKALVRVTIGFPSAVARATGTGLKRLTGVGSLYDFGKAIRETDPMKKALYTKQAIKELGAGATVIPGLFYTLGQAGLISGAYPQDEEERARWEREGISENSIKIGGAWYQFPAYLGAWSVPAMFWGNMGATDGNFGESAKTTAKGVLDVMPIDQMENLSNVMEGKYDPGKFAATFGANTVRALTPAGALLNQLSKSLDPTKNDTNSGTAMENFVDKVLSGIPIVNNMADIPDKVDDAGNPIENPNAAQLAFGAASKVQGEGEQRSAEIEDQLQGRVLGLSDMGAFDDANLKGILDDETKLLYEKAAAGGKISDKELDKLHDALIKGVSQTGDDTSYLEKEQYDTNLTALKLKRKKMEEDGTTKPSDLKKLDTAIKRGEVYRDNEIPYDLISDYQSIGVEDWRKMGDPEDDEYNPDMYQKLWAIDEMMTKAGVSYRKGALDKQKYFVKDKKGSGGSGSGKRTLGGDFGRLEAGSFAPKVQDYLTIDQKAGGVPNIRPVRPNIVHKISSSR